MERDDERSNCCTSLEALRHLDAILIYIAALSRLQKHKPTHVDLIVHSCCGFQKPHLMLKTTCSLRLAFSGLHIVLDRSLQCSRVRADDLADLLAILEEHERRHGAHGEFLRYFWDLVDVELVEARVGVDVGEPVAACVSACLYCLQSVYVFGRDLLDDLRRNDLARPAPRREAVEHHQRALLAHRRVEVGLGLQVVNALLAHGCGEEAWTVGEDWFVGVAKLVDRG